MESGLKSISDLFDGTKQFCIPEYQRAYAWENKNVRDFIDDVLAHPEGHKYFYGTILLRDKGKDKDFELLEVIDGQQRITTITILFFILLKELQTRGSTMYDINIKQEKYIRYHDRSKLKLGDDNDYEFFLTYILSKDKDDINFQEFTTPAQELLWKAKHIMIDKLKELELNKLEAIVNIIENAEILVYSEKESAEAALIFETTNDRGKSLTNLEKIKSFLMYKTFLSQSQKHDSADMIGKIYSRFGEIYRVIENCKSLFKQKEITAVEEDQICQYNFIGFYLWKGKADYQNYLDVLKSHINMLTSQKQFEEVINFIEKYTASLKETFTNFTKLISLKNKAIDEIYYLDRIAIFYPLLLKSYHLDKTENKSQLSELLEICSKLSFRVFSLRFKRTNDLDIYLNKLCRDFIGDFDSLKRNLSNKINESAPISGFVEKLKSQNFYTNEYSKTMNFLFWKYENYLRMNFQPICGEMPYEELTNKDRRYKISIEHITAQALKNGCQFCNISTDEFKETYLHSLGNLTIDPQSSNSSKGAEIWDTKNEKYFEKAPFKTQLELSDYVDIETKLWDEKCINKRRDRIIEVAKALWNVEEYGKDTQPNESRIQSEENNRMPDLSVRLKTAVKTGQLNKGDIFVLDINKIEVSNEIAKVFINKFADDPNYFQMELTGEDNKRKVVKWLHDGQLYSIRSLTKVLLSQLKVEADYIHPYFNAWKNKRTDQYLVEECALVK